MNAKRRAASLLLGVLLAACAGTPASPTPTGSPPPVPITTPSPTATPALPSASHAASPAPAASPSVTSTASATPSSATKDEGRPACPDPPTHVVAAGETLSGIAQGYGVTVQALRAANPQIRDPRLIHPGDAIVISPIDLGASWVRDPLLINDRGQIAGSADGGSGDFRAFLWQGGTLTDLGTLGGRASVAHDINDRGQVVGQADTASGEEHAFLWQDGTMTDLGTLGGKHGIAVAINERGQIVGWSDDAAGDQRAFLWQDGTMTDLGTLGGKDTSASAINDRGQVVGASTTTSGEEHAFLWQGGTMTDLGTLYGGGSGAGAINDEGQIVGMAADPPGGPDIIFDQGRGFVWQDGVMRDLGIDFDGNPEAGAGLTVMNERGQVIVTTGDVDAVLWQNGTQTTVGAHSKAYGLNDRGEVVGWHSAVDDVPSNGFVPGNAFLWRDGTMTDLGSLKGTQSRAMGINECGQIVGMSGLRGVTWYTR